MDKKIKKKKYIGLKVLVGILGLGLIGFLGYSFKFQQKKVNIKKEKLTIKTVEYNYFEDVVMFNGIIEPLNTALVNTLESGVVQNIKAEDGKMVQKGEVLLELYNPTTEFNYLTQETAIVEQINNLRNTRISIKNQQLNLDRDLAEINHNFNTAKSEYSINENLFLDSLISKRDFNTSKEDFRYQKEIQTIFKSRVQSEKTDRITQLDRINISIQKMEESLKKLQSNKDNFLVKANASGKLSSFTPTIGQSFQSGESVGKIDLMDGYKITARIDEYYVSQIQIGLEASLIFENRTFRLQVSKVLPEVTDRQFDIELVFIDQPPSSMKRGMNFPMKIYLSDQQAKTHLLPKGSFYQTSGGKYVFVVNKEGNAEKRNITLGKSNPYFYEVLEGLNEEDKVITSSYEHYGDMDIIHLQ